jgi:hypothetical protein
MVLVPTVEQLSWPEWPERPRAMVWLRWEQAEPCAMPLGRAEAGAPSCLKPCRTPRWSPLSWATLGMVAHRGLSPWRRCLSLSSWESDSCHRRSRWWTKGSQKHIVSPRENPPHIKHSPSVEMVGADKWTIGTTRGKAHYKSPSWRANCRCFLHWHNTWWSRSRVPVLMWPCEQWSTQWSILVQAPLSHPIIPISECEPFSTINLNFQKDFIWFKLKWFYFIFI